MGLYSPARPRAALEQTSASGNVAISSPRRSVIESSDCPQLHRLRLSSRHEVSLRPESGSASPPVQGSPRLASNQRGEVVGRWPPRVRRSRLRRLGCAAVALQSDADGSGSERLPSVRAWLGQAKSRLVLRGLLDVVLPRSRAYERDSCLARPDQDRFAPTGRESIVARLSRAKRLARPCRPPPSCASNRGARPARQRHPAAARRRGARVGEGHR